jgi:hypothetical protein
VYIQELEKKVAMVSNENAENKAKIEVLQSENMLVKEQLAYLRSFIAQAISFSFSSQGNNGTDASSNPSSSSLPAPYNPPNLNLSSLPPQLLSQLQQLSSVSSPDQLIAGVNSHSREEKPKEQ